MKWRHIFSLPEGAHMSGSDRDHSSVGENYLDPRGRKLSGKWRKQYNKELYDLYALPNTIIVFN